MTLQKFIFYVGMAYLVYYSINLLLDFVRARRPSIAKRDYEDFVISGAEETPRKIERLEQDGDLDRFQEKKN